MFISTWPFAPHPALSPAGRGWRKIPLLLRGRGQGEGERWASIGNEENLAGGLAAFEGPVGVGGLGLRELVLDAKLELAVADPAEHFPCPLDKLLAGGDVVVQARPLDIERAPRIEHRQVEGRHRTARSE